MTDLRVSRSRVIPADELLASASRSSGPGGQHVNKASTRVTLRWNIETSVALSDRQRTLLQERLAHRSTRAGDLIVHASRARSRARNLESARARLVEIVSAALATRRKRIATKASPGVQQRRVEQKRRRSAVKRERRRPGIEE